jgi:hypothetical protein
LLLLCFWQRASSNIHDVYICVGDAPHTVGAPPVGGVTRSTVLAQRQTTIYSVSFRCLQSACCTAVLQNKDGMYRGRFHADYRAGTPSDHHLALLPLSKMGCIAGGVTQTTVAAHCQSTIAPVSACCNSKNKTYRRRANRQVAIHAYACMSSLEFGEV